MSSIKVEDKLGVAQKVEPWTKSPKDSVIMNEMDIEVYKVNRCHADHMVQVDRM